MIDKMAASMQEGNVETFPRILTENITNIREMCSKYKNKDAGIEAFAERSLEKLDELEKKLQQMTSSGKTSDLNLEQVKECVQLYAQILLDVTFCEENILVDGVFPEKNAAIRVQKLLMILRQPEVICQHCFPQLTPKELLGEEVLECLLWRRGALLYMYCHTIQEDTLRLSKECMQFIENCKDGAVYLQQMLQVRTPMKEDRHQVLANDEHMFTLLKKGIFSETHVLSLLYAGELCYWHVKHNSSSPNSETQETPDLKTTEEKQEASSQNSQTKEKPSSEEKDSTKTEAESRVCAEGDSSSTSTSDKQEKTNEKSQSIESFSAHALGTQMLELYVEIVQGPLKDHGWRLERARDLLTFIQQSHKQPETPETV